MNDSSLSGTIVHKVMNNNNYPINLRTVLFHYGDIYRNETDYPYCEIQN